MKPFSVSCNERSIVIEYLDDSKKRSKTTLIFADITEKYIFSNISWTAIFIALMLDSFLIFKTISLGSTNPFFLGVIFFSFISSLKFVNTLEKVIRLNFTKEGRQISRIHSAIHKAVNAMISEDSLVPSIAKIKKASRFSRFCDSVYATESILLGFLALPIIVFTHQSFWLCLISLILLRVLLQNLLYYGMLNFLQFFFLRKPTEREINLVNEMLNQSNEFIKLIQKNS